MLDKLQAGCICLIFSVSFAIAASPNQGLSAAQIVEKNVEAFVLETKVLPVAKNTLGMRDTAVPTEKIVIDKVVVNPKVEEKLFSKVEVPAVSKSK